MIYVVFPANHAYQLRDDLSVRRLALMSPEIERVETVTGRVVYRRVPEAVVGLHAAKKPMPDIDLIELFGEPPAEPASARRGGVAL